MSVLSSILIPVHGAGKPLVAKVNADVLFHQSFIAFLLVLAMLMFSSIANARFEAHTFPSAQAEKDYAELVQELQVKCPDSHITLAIPKTRLCQGDSKSNSPFAMGGAMDSSSSISSP